MRDGRGGRMVRGADLRLLPGFDAFLSLVVPCLGTHPVAAHLMSMELPAGHWGLLKRAAAAFLICLPPCAWGIAGGTPSPVREAVAAQRLPPSAVSFAVVDPENGGVVIGQNADTPRSPASTIKVVTTFAALDTLGPAYAWHTRALIRGQLNDGVLEGDLILQGGGDPYMTLERWWSFAHALRGKALKAIHGDIVIDNTAFSLPSGDPGEFDGRPNRAYNVVPDALMVNFQSVEFRLLPDVGARRVDIIASPTPANLAIENHLRIAAGRCRGAAGQVDFKVASAHWDRWSSAARCRRIARSAVLPECCWSPLPMHSARSPSCGASSAASLPGSCASRARPPMRSRFSSSIP